MHRAAQYLKDLLLPPRCVICDRVIAPCERPFCRVCAAVKLARIEEEVCRKCGREKTYCTCKRETFLSDGIAAPFYYIGEIKNAIRLFKTYDDADRSDFFAAAMERAIVRAYGDLQIDYVTWVPMHNKALARRGFDQVKPLARYIARAFHTPLMPMLRKNTDTPLQKELTIEQRRCNLLGTFDIRKKVPVKHSRILLVDDVLTTGSTTNECAKMLKIYGAESVYVIAVALTRIDKKTEKGESVCPSWISE